jgi:hypothetical protein
MITIRKIAAVLGSAFLVAVIALPLVACGGGGSPEPTSVPYTKCKPAEPVVPSTPTDLPPGVSEYQSPERGYSVRYPSDWTVEANRISLATMAGDVFFSASAEGEVKPNLSVSCEMLRVGTTSEQFLDTKLGVIEALRGQRPSVEETVTVDGKEASLVRYKVTTAQTPEPLTVDKIDIFFADDLGGWTLTLVAPEGMIDTYRPVLDAFVASFHGP